MRRVRSKTTGQVGVELTPYGFPRWELRIVQWDDAAGPATVGHTVLEDEGNAQDPSPAAQREDTGQ